MSEAPLQVAGSPEILDAAPEPIRVLIPSALGSLGIEFRDKTLQRLVIVPSRKDRSSYASMADIDQSDFLDEALGRFSEYFAGARRNLGLEYELPVDDLDELAIRVLHETARIPYGETCTYQRLAQLAGASSAYRAVRSILMQNPMPILIPCHRVTPQRGGGGSWIGGTKKKQMLLKMEKQSADRLAAAAEAMQ